MKPKQTESEYTSEQEKRDASFQALFPKKKQKQATRKKKNVVPIHSFRRITTSYLNNGTALRYTTQYTLIEILK